MESVHDSAKAHTGVSPERCCGGRNHRELKVKRVRDVCKCSMKNWKFITAHFISCSCERCRLRRDNLEEGTLRESLKKFPGFGGWAAKTSVLGIRHKSHLFRLSFQAPAEN